MQTDTRIEVFGEFISLMNGKKPPQHKGENGVVLVVGGSLYYTGAPFFVSIAALKGVCHFAFVAGCRYVLHYMPRDGVCADQMLQP